jgi:hypothetical protein
MNVDFAQEFCDAFIRINRRMNEVIIDCARQSELPDMDYSRLLARVHAFAEARRIVEEEFESVHALVRSELDQKYGEATE